jgi:hypothetical protein
MSMFIKSYAFTRVVRSQSTLQRQLRRQMKKKPLYGIKKLQSTPEDDK